jgi:hypothetical protein
MLLHGELPAKLYPPPHSVPRTTWGVLELLSGLRAESVAYMLRFSIIEFIHFVQ